MFNQDFVDEVDGIVSILSIVRISLYVQIDLCKM